MIYTEPDMEDLAERIEGVEGHARINVHYEQVYAF
jgi:hypothetical protein